jgi:hypothetical protein
MHVHGPQLYLNLSCQDVEMLHITHRELLLGGGCGAAAMFCHLSGTSGTHPPEVKRWWGRIGKRYRRESPARG